MSNVKDLKTFRTKVVFETSVNMHEFLWFVFP
jgi:hypothetical protein